MNDTTFKKGIAIFTACMKDFKLPEKLDDSDDTESHPVEIWFELLKDLDNETFLTAVHKICQTTSLYPGSNIVALIREAATGGDSLETQSAIAWAKFDKAFHEHGTDKTLIFDDPIIHMVVEVLGGWRQLGDTLKDDWKWLRKDFEKYYKAYAPNIQNMSPPKRLVGLIEHQNLDSRFKNHFLAIPLPIFIGDEQKALAWTGEQKALTDKQGGCYE